MTVLVRHAESEWNRAFGTYRIDAGITDPGLTPTGVGQARELADRLLDSGIGRIVASPYRRTLQTAAIVAEALGCRSRSSRWCASAAPSPATRVARRRSWPREWPDLDFGGLGDLLVGRRDRERRILAARCTAFRGAAAGRARPGPPLLVVSHWGFIRGLTGAEVKIRGPVRLDHDAPADHSPGGAFDDRRQHPERRGRGRQDQASPAPRLSILTQYVKDLSFENPRAPFGLQAKPARPEIQIQVDVHARQLGDGQLRGLARAERRGQAPATPRSSCSS